MHDCKEESFLKYVENHSMKIIRDDDLHRHLSFTNNGSSVYRFDLITWPGHLCISGDCGTYVFARIPDMFSFFRMDKNDFNYSEKRGLNINPGYWGEKLKSIDKQGRYKDYYPEIFEEKIKEYFEDWEFESEDQKEDVWAEIEAEVLNNAYDGETRAFDAALCFESSNGHQFDDFWEVDSTDYTFHYIWCLYAIVYGIHMYDQSKKQDAV